MMRRPLAWLALAVLLVPLAQAASSGARSPITVDGAVSEVAMASSGRFAAGNADPGNRFTNGDVDVPTWNLWNVDGSLRQSGSADPIDTDSGTCPPNDNMPLEDCSSPVTALALSADGEHIVVASVRTTTQNLLSCFNSAGTLLGRVTVGGTIRDVATSQDGGRVAMVYDSMPAPGDDPVGHLQVYDGSCKNPTFSPTAGIDYPAAATRVSLSPDGSYLAVAADAHHYYKLTSPTDYRHAVSGAHPTDVDVSGTGGWSVAGFSNGFFGVYSGEISQTLPREYQKKESGDSSGLTAVAIRRDATAFVTGSSGGTLRYYSLDTGSSDPVTLVATKSSLGSIQNVTFSGDGHYLAVRSGNDLRLYRAHADGVDELWKDTRATFGRSVAVDQRGEHVVANAGSTVIVYDAVHKLTPSLPSQTQDPGTTATYSVSYRNDGNRMEDITLSASPPAGVGIDIDPDTFTVVPGASKSVSVTVTLPDTRGPGATSIPLTHKLSGGTDGQGSATLSVTVPTKRDLRLEPDGASSLGVAPGGVAVFDVVAKNGGNVVETGALSLVGLPQGWTADLEPDSLNLQPGGQVDVTVSVTPPANAPACQETCPPGSQASFLLQRSGGPSLPLTATVGAGFGASLDGPRGMLLLPGVSSLLNLTVKNTGNAPDSFVVKLGNLPPGWQSSFLSGLAEHRLDRLQPGESAVVQATIRPPADSASTAAVQFTATAQSLGDDTKKDSHLVLLTVDEPLESDTESTSEGDGGDGNGIPGLPPMVLVGALLVVGLLMRRRA